MTERKKAWSQWLQILITIFLLERVTSIQYTPVALSGGVGDGECALLLNGPGRSSSFDYNLNILRGGNGFGYNGPNTCITYDAVNSAYLEARKRIQVAQPHGDYKPEELATIGELLLDISVNLARIYGLSYEEIEKGLPLIDTSKTLIREICPPFLSNVECRPGKYRRFDGLCTNLENPTWGATMQPFTRLIGPLYADGMTAPRISVTGNQLPLSRVVSRTMHPDEGYHDHAGTVMVIAWGQFIDHDYTLTATPLDPLNRNDPEECCKRPPHLKNPYCNEIRIPDDDYFYRLFNVRCIDFVRGFPAIRPGCRLGSRSQFNTLTGVLDANTVYGVTEKFARKLRSGYGGQLRMNPVFREYGLKDLLPLKLDIPDEGCTRPNRSMFCFEAGEIRVNEQLVLTCMHTLMAREHNRIAEGLAQVNPHWDDETLFQEARRINIAEVQHITYNEFLPILLGKEVMEKFGLLLQKNGYWDGYDPTVNPNVIDAFAAAAYRFGHSLLPTAVERWSKAHKFIASKRLSDLIRRPYDLYRAGIFDEYFMGLMNQVAQAMDDSITQEVTNHLFKKVGAKFGMDLVSFNMQRGREFGLPGYMEFRKFCGLPGADTFNELFGSMPNETIKRYSTIFEHPHDVDLWSGGVSERPLPGSMLGPTFACIIATQFSYSRRGDRFWYELPNQPSSFTPEQLQEIRKARLARVICDNTDLIDTIQLYPMVLPDHEINPRVPCKSGILPSIDFSKWADFKGQNFHQQQPFTSNKTNISETTEISTQKSTPKLEVPALLKNMNVTAKNVHSINRIKRNIDNTANFASSGINQNNSTNIFNNLHKNINKIKNDQDLENNKTQNTTELDQNKEIKNSTEIYLLLEDIKTDIKLIPKNDSSNENIKEQKEIDEKYMNNEENKQIEKLDQNKKDLFDDDENIKKEVEDITEKFLNNEKNEQNEKSNKNEELSESDEMENSSTENKNNKKVVNNYFKDRNNYDYTMSHSITFSDGKSRNSAENKEETQIENSKQIENIKEESHQEKSDLESINENDSKKFIEEDASLEKAETEQVYEDNNKENIDEDDTASKELINEQNDKENVKKNIGDEEIQQESLERETDDDKKEYNHKTELESVEAIGKEEQIDKNINENQFNKDEMPLVPNFKTIEKEVQSDKKEIGEINDNVRRNFDDENQKEEIKIPESDYKIGNHEEENKEIKQDDEKTMNITTEEKIKEISLDWDDLMKRFSEIRKEFDEPYGNTKKNIKNKDDTSDDSYDSLKDFEYEEEIDEESKKYIDDDISKQLSINQNLRGKVIYPDSDRQYETYRKSTQLDYLLDKKQDFSAADQPYDHYFDDFSDTFSNKDKINEDKELENSEDSEKAENDKEASNHLLNIVLKPEQVLK